MPTKNPTKTPAPTEKASKCLLLTYYTYDYFEFSKVIAAAPLGPDGKAALIVKYNEITEPAIQLYLSTEDRPGKEEGRAHYAIEEIDYLQWQ